MHSMKLTTQIKKLYLTYFLHYENLTVAALIVVQTPFLNQITTDQEKVFK